MHKLFRYVVVGTLCAALASSAAWAQANASSAERGLFESVNRERKGQGLSILKWDDALATAARGHAEGMAQQNSVAHTLPGEPSLAGRATKAGMHFSWISENIVQSTSAAGAHAQFMKSPNHKANVLDTDMDSVGIGVAESAGQLFVVEDFAKKK